MVNEYVEFTFDLTNKNSEINMNSNALNDICSSHEYFVYFDKITFREIYTIVKIWMKIMYYIIHNKQKRIIKFLLKYKKIMM